MRTGHQRQTIVVIERLRDVLPESVSSTTGRDPPAASVVGITPQQVAHGPLVGNLLDAVEGADVVEGVDGGTQTAVETEDLVFDEGGEGEVVEQIGEVLPDIGVAVLAQAFIVEPINLGDLTGLVVPTKDGDPLGVTDFKAHEEGDGLDGVVATIDIITWEVD